MSVWLTREFADSNIAWLDSILVEHLETKRASVLILDIEYVWHFEALLSLSANLHCYSRQRSASQRYCVSRLVATVSNDFLIERLA